jgi:hypothetical protein
MIRDGFPPEQSGFRTQALRAEMCERQSPSHRQHRFREIQDQHPDEGFWLPLQNKGVRHCVGIYQSFIKSIEIYPDAKPDGRIVKHIDFKFPVSIDDEDGENLLLKQNDVETVCLLTHS